MGKGTIDLRMQQIYQGMAKNANANEIKLSREDAEKLIKRAEEINNTPGSCRSHKHKGNKDLNKLLDQYGQQFSVEGRMAIRQFIQTGHAGQRIDSTSISGGHNMSFTSRPLTYGSVPGSIHGTGYPATGGGGHPSGNVLLPSIGASSSPYITSPRDGGYPGGVLSGAGGGRGNGRDAVNVDGNNDYSGHGSLGAGSGSAPIYLPGAPTTNRPVGGGVRPGGGVPHGGNTGPVGGPNPPVGGPTTLPVGGPSTPVTGPANPVVGGPVTQPVTGPGTSPVTGPGTSPVTGPSTSPVTGPNGETVILDWRAQKETFECHWFPFQASTPNDATNNLYVKDGALDKLDKLTGKNSRGYEYEHYHYPKEAGPSVSWYGNCNYAAEVSTLLQAPKHSVVKRDLEGNQIKFTRNDIQGLLVKVIGNLVERVDFKGERFNSNARDNRNDPSPDLFMKVVQEWAADGQPFIMDIDHSEQVWNFPYDQVKIVESNNAPDGARDVSLSGNGTVKYYHIEMSGTGYPKLGRVYECFVEKDSRGETINSGWIKTATSNNNPDFLWRAHPVGDLNNKELWQLRGQPNNPEIDPQIIYDIYMESLV